ncbi:MAG: hypothetical protein PHP10_03660 [Candidatus Omnitrophica bacterium]|nr:hypothetical protein [Candidatus Omnitrophota bacterium]
MKAKENDLVKSICLACGAVGEKKKRPAPKNNKEKAQMDFRCRGCGAINLRGGHKAIYDSGMPPEKGSLTPKDKKKALPQKVEVKSQKPPDAAPQVKPPERSIEHEETDDSPTIL